MVFASKVRAGSSILITLAATIGLASTAAIVSKSRFGSVAAGIDYLAGKRILAEASERDFGVVPVGGEATARFRMSNLTGRPVVVLGGKTSCTCAMVTGLPLTIPPRGGADLTVVVRDRPGQGAHEVAENILLYTDSPDQPSVDLKVVGRFIAAPGTTIARARRDDGEQHILGDESAR